MRIDFLNEKQKLDLEYCISRLAQLTDIRRHFNTEVEELDVEIESFHIRIEVLALKGMKKNEEHKSK